MARLVGVDLPNDKRVEVALTYIYGIGRTRALQTLDATGVSGDRRAIGGRLLDVREHGAQRVGERARLAEETGARDAIERLPPVQPPGHVAERERAAGEQRRLRAGAVAVLLEAHEEGPRVGERRLQLRDDCLVHGVVFTIGGRVC